MRHTSSVQPLVRKSRYAIVAAVTAILLTGVSCASGATVRTDAAAPPVQQIRAEAPALQAGGSKPRVLFIRGAEGSAPAGGTPTLNDLSDITNLGSQPDNKGFGVWAKYLADNGYEVSQLNETGTRQNRQPVDLKKAKLDQYAVVIFASNNARYQQGDSQELTRYVRGGGGVLFLSDTNWGPDDTSAPQSDSDLLANFGVQMNKDNGVMASEKYTSNDFTEPNHPIFQGVTSFDGLGVSSCTQLANAPENVSILVLAKSPIHPVAGGERPTTTKDATLLVFEPEQGRGACYYDRDSFFNGNFTKQSHEQLAGNLVNWLAKRN